jgi:hypothetical protein
MAGHWPDVDIGDWLKNASASLVWTGQSRLPVSVSFAKRQRDATYINSPRTGWFDYVAHEVSQHRLIAVSIRVLGWMARAFGIDRIIVVGNYPVSTSVWTLQQVAEIPSAAEEMSERKPDFFVGVRNILPCRDSKLISALTALGFVGLPARVIYEFDFRGEFMGNFSHLKKDFALFKRLNIAFEVASRVEAVDAKRMQFLYEIIYLHKHSTLNPQYSAQFFSDLINSGVATYLSIRDSNNRILSFALLWTVGEILTVPALGYDQATGDHGSYRVLFVAIYRYARDHKLLLNYSSGAGEFKRRRGGVARLEYTYIRCPNSASGFKRACLKMVSRRLASVTEQSLIKVGA